MNKRVALFSGMFLCAIGIVYLFNFYSARHHQTITLYGNVDIRDVNLAFRVSGRLLELKVDEGDAVHKGELVAHLDPAPYERELNAAKATIEQQKATLAYAETVLAREKRLLGTGASSPDKYQNALSARDAAKAGLEKAIADTSQAALSVQDTLLYSPSDGVILTRAVEPGTMLAIGAPVLTVSLITPVWVRAYISETQLTKAKQGTPVTVYTDSNPGKSYKGVIGFVSPTAEFTPKNVETTDLRTELVYRLRIIMQDPNHDLRQGMPVTVQLAE
ncbi:MAG: efflux RND transporter periplasmic adaptor subunit [Legionellales bacterium]